jgi:hypothetical protein
MMGRKKEDAYVPRTPMSRPKKKKHKYKGRSWPIQANVPIDVPHRRTKKWSRKRYRMNTGSIVTRTKTTFKGTTSGGLPSLNKKRR